MKGCRDGVEEEEKMETQDAEEEGRRRWRNLVKEGKKKLRAGYAEGGGKTLVEMRRGVMW